MARRNSFETGALRYFAIEYVDDPESLADRLAPSDADGKVLVCLAESPSLTERFRELAMNAAENRDVLFAIPQLIGELRAVVTELGALRWVWENTPELRDDRVARREISLRIADADQLLQRSVDGLLDPRGEPVGSGCLWIHAAHSMPLHSPVEVSQLLSDVCDGIYHKTPIIRNELITRRTLSSAAAAARRNLIERMLGHHADEALGMEGYPPERSMYESVLRATGLHRQDKDGVWRFQAPGRRDLARIRACWNYLRDTVFCRQLEPIPIDGLFSKLAAPPYGVMPGLHPVLLCAFMLAHPDETTLYREGTFLPEPGIEDFEVLMRRPELFAVAGSRMSAGRAAVVRRIAKGLLVKPATVPVVRALFRVAKGLPEFAHSTMELSPATIAMRQAFASAKSPEQFLFHELPRSLGVEPFDTYGLNRSHINAFFASLNRSLQEWSRATPKMIDAARDALLEACGLPPGAEGWQRLRETAQRLEPGATNRTLLPFLRRVSQSDGGQVGVEAVLALLANRPPLLWTDSDAARLPAIADTIGGLIRASLESVPFEGCSSSLAPAERQLAETMASRIEKQLTVADRRIPAHILREALLILARRIAGQSPTSMES